MAFRTVQAESNLEKELMDLIQCVICLDTPTQSTHIYQCENGHLFCGECLEKVKNCSVCRTPLTKNSRNLMIEKVLSILKSYRHIKKDKKESKLEENSFTLNVNAKVFEPKKKKIITEESKLEIENEDWCQVVKKKRNVKLNPPNENFNQNFLTPQKKNGLQETVKIRISNNFAGLILRNRNGGSVLNNIQSDSKTKIDCGDSVKGSNERILTIYGTQKQIQRAQFLLMRAEEGIIMVNGKESKKMAISENFAAYLLGDECAIQRGIETDSKANLFIIDSKHCSEEISREFERTIVISGSPKQIQRAEFLIQNPSKIKINEEKETIQLEFPCRMAGAIIGSEGQRIRGVESCSNARFYIDDESQGTVKRMLTISGTQEQIKKAQSLLPPCVTVANPQESRSANENNDVLGHHCKKKPLPILK